MISYVGVIEYTVKISMTFLIKKNDKKHTNKQKNQQQRTSQQTKNIQNSLTIGNITQIKSLRRKYKGKTK